MVYSIHLKSHLLQAFCKRWIILKIEHVKFKLFSRSKVFDLKHSTVLIMFQKKLCYSYNHLGVIPFEYIAGVTRDDKRPRLTSLPKSFWWTSGQVTAYAEKMQIITYLFYFYFL